MAQERVMAPLAEFFKFTRKGQKVAGRIVRFFANDNGQSVILEPCVIFLHKDQAGRTFGNIAIGLQTDLRYKLNSGTDVGKWISIEYIDSEPSKKGNPKKVYRVLELEPKEMGELARGADRANRGNPFRAMLLGEDGHTEQVLDDGDDELPF